MRCQILFLFLTMTRFNVIFSLLQSNKKAKSIKMSVFILYIWGDSNPWPSALMFGNLSSGKLSPTRIHLPKLLMASHPLLSNQHRAPTVCSGSLNSIQAAQAQSSVLPRPSRSEIERTMAERLKCLCVYSKNILACVTSRLSSLTMTKEWPSFNA